MLTSIWTNDGATWKLLAPAGFPDEATLHRLIEEAPQVLPLSGSIPLTIVGREVGLGNGYADLVAIEPSGRVCIIEIKLARNAEARRAVVSQVLTYAAYLKGLTPSTFEQQILAQHLATRRFNSLSEAVVTTDQTGEIDPVEFQTGLTTSLREGAFRLVIVLDEAPDELVHLIGYLESVANLLVIDLITIASYDINGSQVIVPQRIEPERFETDETITLPTPVKKLPAGQLSSGAGEFRNAAASVPSIQRDHIFRLAAWAEELATMEFVTLSTYISATRRVTLLPRLQPENVGLVTIWIEGGGTLSLWRSVFERRAPGQIQRIESLIAPIKIGQGTTLKPDAISSALLEALADAYRDATSTEAVRLTT